MAKYKALPRHRAIPNPNTKLWVICGGLFVGALIAGITPAIW